MTIFNPDGTTNTNDKAALLSVLMEWTTTGPILAALVKRNLADGEGLWRLALMAKATADDLERSKLVDGDERPLEPLTGPAEPLDERRICCALLAFLTDPPVRNVVAQYVSQAHGRRYEAAKRDLYELRVDLTQRHGIKRHEIPPLKGIDAATRESLHDLTVARMIFVNPGLRYDPASPPEWLDEYKADPESTMAPFVEYLRQLPVALQILAAKFPPDALVRSDMDVPCPPPEHLAIVKGYDVEEETGRAVVLVAGYVDEMAPTANAAPEWLELVACRGGVTCEAVAEVLAEVVH